MSVQAQAISGQDQAALLFEELNFIFCMGTGDFPLSLLIVVEKTHIKE